MSANVFASTYKALGATTAGMMGGVATGGTAVRFGNLNALSSGKVASFFKDAMVSEVAYVDYLGEIYTGTYKHLHTNNFGSPSSVGASNSDGTSTNAARSDHQHDHGTQSNGMHHAAATTSVNGFMLAADKTKLDNLKTDFTLNTGFNADRLDGYDASVFAQLGARANFTCAFSSYVADGLFGATASPSYIQTPAGTSQLLFGYDDGGNGQYVPRIGFLAVASAYQTATKASLGIVNSSGDFTINGGASNSEFLRIKYNGNVGIGTNSPTALLSVGPVTSGFTGFSTLFRVRHPTVLAATVASELNIASFNAIGPANECALGVRMYRYAAGSDWTSASLILSYDVDNTARAGSYITLAPYGVGVGTVSPGTPLDVRGAGSFYGAGVDGALGDTLIFGATAYPTSYKNKIQCSVSSVVGNSKFNFQVSSGTTTYADALLVQSTGCTAYDFIVSSDERLKENIEAIPSPLEKVLGLRGVNYSLKADETHTKKMGVIAQEVEKIIPEVVHTDYDTGMKSVSYGSMVAVLVEAMKEQEKTIKNQQAQIDELAALVKKLVG